MTPVADGRTHHFFVIGVYNGLALLSDRETGSYWEHMTGECIHGARRGDQLPFIDSLSYLSTGQALETDAQLEVALSSPSWKARFFYAVLWPRLRRDRRPQGMIPPHFYRTMDDRDGRRERMDMGLGVWGEGYARYYPLERIRQAGGALIDAHGDQALLVYMDPSSSGPAALFTDAAACRWDHDELCLLDGEQIVATLGNGLLHVGQGNALNMERPQQLFTRWYGFAYTFPRCSIYGES